MRFVTTLFVLAALFLGLQVLARGADEPAADLQALQDRIQTLEREVAYLRARDLSLTAYALAHKARGEALEGALRRVEGLGFTQAAIPFSSREALLGALADLARGLRADLPEVTKEQKALLEAR